MTTTTPHVRLTTRDLKEQYLTGKLTVKGYIYNWILATRKRGWRYRTKVKDFCQELGISRSAFYKAIAELRAEGNFYFEVYGEIEMWVEEASTIIDKVSTIVDTASTVIDTASTIIENETPKPAQNKASRAPTDLDQISSDLLQEGDEDCLSENEEATARDGLVDPQPAEDPIDVAKILEETKKQLLAAVQKQRKGRKALGALEAAEEDEVKALSESTTSSSHGGHGEHHGQWDQGNSPRLVSTVATGSAMSGRRGSQGEDYGGHGGHYGWRVRGGGLQPLAGILSHGGYHEGVPPFPRGIP